MMITIDIYWDDLTPEKQHEISEVFGDNNNWDVFPICTIEVEEDGGV